MFPLTLRLGRGFDGARMSVRAREGGVEGEIKGKKSVCGAQAGSFVNVNVNEYRTHQTNIRTPTLLFPTHHSTVVCTRVHHNKAHKRTLPTQHATRNTSRNTARNTAPNAPFPRRTAPRPRTHGSGAAPRWPPRGPSSAPLRYGTPPGTSPASSSGSCSAPLFEWMMLKVDVRVWNEEARKKMERRRWRGEMTPIVSMHAFSHHTQTTHCTRKHTHT